MYRLINARPSPYGRKVAIALSEMKIEFETIFDLPWGEAAATRLHSPLEQLPILIPPNGDAIWDSSFILQWLEAHYPERCLLPDGRDDRLDALKLQMLGERLMEIAQAIIFETYRPQPSDQGLERGTRKIVRGLEEAERLVAGAAVPGECDPIHLGQIALGTTLLVWEFVVAEKMSPAIDALVWRDRHPALTRLVEALETRPSFIATAPSTMPVDIAAEVA